MIERGAYNLVRCLARPLAMMRRACRAVMVEQGHREQSGLGELGLRTLN